MDNRRGSHLDEQITAAEKNHTSLPIFLFLLVCWLYAPLSLWHFPLALASVFIIFQYCPLFSHSPEGF